MEKNNPLVTVGVVTYNSARHVIETLESIKAQTYKNIELIVSDDFSSDNTVEICKKWIDENKNSFVKAQLLTVKKNTGTSGNCNRILKESDGSWIKLIAGDDLFLPTAIQDYMDFVSKESNINICFSEAIHFYGNLIDKKFSYEKIEFEDILFSPKVTAKRQYNVLTKIFIGSGPTFFFKKAVVERVGGFDERFNIQEDHPLFIKLTKAGFKFYLLDKYTVYKRVTEDSVAHSREKNSIFSNLMIKMIKEWRFQYKYEELNFFWKNLLLFSLFLQNKIIDLGNTKQNRKCYCWHFFYKFFDPFVLYLKYWKIYQKVYRLFNNA